MFSYFPFCLHILSALFAIYLAVKVLFKNPGSPLNRTFTYMMCCCFLWSVGDAMAQHPSALLETAWIGASIASLGWSVTISLLLIFLLEFTGQRKLLKKKYFYVCIFIIPSIVIFKQWNNSFFSHTHEFYGWGLVWPQTPIAYIFYASILVIMTMCVNIMSTFLQNEKDPVRMKQGKTLILASFVNFTLIFIFTIVFPALEMTEIPVIGDVFALAWGAWLYFAGEKHGIFA